MGSLGFYLFGHYIAYYGLMAAVGVCIGSGIGLLRVKQCGLSGNDLIILCAMGALGAVVGAKLLYIIVSFREIDFHKLTDWNYISALMRGGFVFYGGVLGMLPMLWLCNAKFKIHVMDYMQCCIGCIPLGHAFGRVGCHLVGCCYGRPYNGIFAVTYTCSQFAPNGVSLFPVQLTEAVLELLIGIFLLVCGKKWKGLTGLYWYLALYAVCRFCLEFLRADAERGMICGLSTSQILSIILGGMAVYLLIRQKRYQKQEIV